MERVNNAFAEYGTLCHEVLEEWANGTLMSFELADAFAERFDASVTQYFPPFPKGMGQKYFDAGHAYFSTFEGFGNRYEVMGVEERFELRINGWPFVGVIDLVLRDKNTGELIVIDHKTMSSSTLKKQRGTYTRQLYLYAEAVMQKHRCFPSKLMLNLLREGKLVEEPFCMDDLEEVLLWTDSMISSILQEERWEARPSAYFCDHICSVSDRCPTREGSLPCM